MPSKEKRFSYSCISEFDEIFAEHPKNAELRQICQKAIRQYSNRGNETKDSFTSGPNEVFVYITGSDGYAAIAPKGKVPMRSAFGMLEYMCNKHSRGQKNLSKFIKNVMDTYNDPSQDKLTQIQDEISSTKEVMLENIDKAMEREQRLEDSAQMAANLSDSSSVFKKQARTAKRNARAGNCMITLILLGVILGILVGIAVVVIAVVCGSGNC